MHHALYSNMNECKNRHTFIHSFMTFKTQYVCGKVFITAIQSSLFTFQQKIDNIQLYCFKFSYFPSDET